MVLVDPNTQVFSKAAVHIRVQGHAIFYKFGIE
jgi:hypothetical protein